MWWSVARGKGVDWNCTTYPILKGIHDAPNSRYNQESRRAPRTLTSMRRRPVDSGGDDAPLFSLDGSGGGGGGIYPTVSAPPSSYSRGPPQRKIDHHGSVQAINVREEREAVACRFVDSLRELA